jgi:predicted RNA-binding protein YlqC (UPF0109 family)
MMLKLQGSIVSQDEKVRRHIRGKLAGHEREINKLLARGAQQMSALRTTIYKIGKELAYTQKVVVDGNYPGGFDKYLRDAHDYIHVPRTTVMRYISNYQQVDRLELPSSFLSAADSAHIDLAATRSLKILALEKISDIKKMAADKFVKLFIRRPKVSSENRRSTPVDDLKGWAEKAAGEALEVVATFQEKQGATPEKVAEVAAAAGDALLTRAEEIKKKQS